MNKKDLELYRITEDDLKVIMESVLKRVLKEGSTETQHLRTWEDLKEMIGAEAMLDMIWNILSTDQLAHIITSIQHELSADGFDFQNDDDIEY